MTNCVISLPKLSSGYSKPYCQSRVRNRASGKLGGAVSGCCRKWWSGRSQSGESGLQTWFEHGAASSLFTCSHMLFQCRKRL